MLRSLSFHGYRDSRLEMTEIVLNIIISQLNTRFIDMSTISKIFNFSTSKILLLGITKKLCYGNMINFIVNIMILLFIHYNNLDVIRPNFHFSFSMFTIYPN